MVYSEQNGFWPLMLLQSNPKTAPPPPFTVAPPSRSAHESL